MDKISYLSNADVSAILNLYDQYLQNPDSVELTWRKFFEGFEFAKYTFNEFQDETKTQLNGDIKNDEIFAKEFKVINLIQGYRTRGHLFAKTNPIRERRKYSPLLTLENFGLTVQDLEMVFQAGTQIGIGPATLENIISHLEITYCRTIGAEFMYVRSPEILKWLQTKMEVCKNTPDFDAIRKKNILTKINHAVGFEQFLHTRFTGQKRFSLEGCEAIIPALEEVIEYGAELGIEDFIIGMAHRGRLNVLVNIMQKTYEDVFCEFEGNSMVESLFDGDVKYHLGFSSDITTDFGKKVHLSLAANASHLETVDPVVSGMARAKLDTKHQGNENKIAAIIIHGDASMAGQGIVYELIQMSQLDGYKTGGTIHVVLNNQIGFTTNYTESRSSTYCTDVGKVTLSPVFHVNADDVEGVIYVTKLAMEFRQKFHRDVFIDILGYRKYGHNEGDEPRFTQPLLYNLIDKHPNPRDIYFQKLLDEKMLTDITIKELDADFKNELQKRFELVKTGKIGKSSEQKLGGPWEKFRQSKEEDFQKSPDTRVDEKKLNKLAEKINTLPDGKKYFKKLLKIFEDRKILYFDKKQVDWALAEILAYASLMDEGFHVRLSGQDVQRGTFSHRHAVIKTEDTEEEIVPLNNLSDTQGKFQAFNSLLSEYAVLGFEYGFASVLPDFLVIWEAQFGDFANGAQIMFDQFISSAEDKWYRQNGLVVFLPHGYEGQGPEHSSARIERFLGLCAEENMIVAYPTTPANMFHLLRRQLKFPFRKPLIVFTPKSLLRHPLCVSPVNELTNNRFCEIISDTKTEPEKVNRIIFCTGKIYYDLLKKLEESKKNTIAIIRIEQLYPFPVTQLKLEVSKFKKAKEFLWVQEEPENMGAGYYVERQLRDLSVKFIASPRSASPASGSIKQHNFRQNAVLEKAIG
ncbi:MAG: 2-oxoglutarate dehydrogenase E1 component [Bacteroidetes bacterium RIFCSPLOWO2_12_FULL_37_12]|nr:MAG: 2-oxoglutarate dehydrogenase E1 component [Bacteroidetes bacterium RIFCSPLOWO2_12_FULL_37_12]